MQVRGVKYAFWLVGIVVALLIVWYLWLSKGTPPGQPALRSLTQNNLLTFTAGSSEHKPFITDAVEKSARNTHLSILKWTVQKSYA